MSLPQQKFRELVFQLLYSIDIGKPDLEALVDLLMRQLEVTKKTVRQAQERVNLILAKQKEIDVMITKSSLSYEFARIQSTERNILRLGVFELFYDDKIPPKVAISEAMRLSRKFSSPEASSFVNAILDSLYKASLGEKVDNEQINDTIRALQKSEELATEAAKEAQKKPEEK